MFYWPFAIYGHYQVAHVCMHISRSYTHVLMHPSMMRHVEPLLLSRRRSSFWKKKASLLFLKWTLFFVRGGWKWLVLAARSLCLKKQQRHSCMHAPPGTSTHGYYCAEQTFMHLIREHDCSLSPARCCQCNGSSFTQPTFSYSSTKQCWCMVRSSIMVIGYVKNV